MQPNGGDLPRAYTLRALCACGLCAPTVYIVTQPSTIAVAIMPAAERALAAR